MVEKPRPFIPTRRSLLTRLKHWDDAQSWQEFFDTYWKLIYSTALEAGLTDAEAQDVVQETILTVAKKFHEDRYRYRARPGSFKAWLLNTTRWRIHDQFRQRQGLPKRCEAGVESASETPATERVPDPASVDLEAVWERDWEQNLMDAAIERVKLRVHPKQYQVFDLHVVKGWPAQKVRQRLEVSLAQIYYAKHKVSLLIKRELRRLEAKGI